MRAFVSLFLAFCLSAVSLFAQSLKATPLKTTPEYDKALREALRAFMIRDHEATIKHLDEAEKLIPPTPTTLNVRGAVAIEQKKYDEGRKLCEQALKTDPKFFPARFNLAEIPFLQKEYAKARTEFEAMQQADPKNELLKFRIYLTYLLEKNDDKAKEMLDAIPLLNDTPIYFFANAAWSFAHADEPAAISFLQSAYRAFYPAQIVIFADTFVDLGWLKRPARNQNGTPILPDIPKPQSLLESETPKLDNADTPTVPAENAAPK